MAAIDNGNGPVKLTGESAGKAVSAAKVVGQGHDLQLELQYKNTPAGVYPAVLVTYEIALFQGPGLRQGRALEGLPVLLRF